MASRVDGSVGLGDPLAASDTGTDTDGDGDANAVMYPVVGSNELMSQKGHGTTAAPLQRALRYGVSASTAKRIVCYNRTRAENFGYFLRTKVKSVQLNWNTAVIHLAPPRAPPLL